LQKAGKTKLSKLKWKNNFLPGSCFCREYLNIFPVFFYME